MREMGLSARQGRRRVLLQKLALACVLSAKG
jgi:hypothetical protein